MEFEQVEQSVNTVEVAEPQQEPTQTDVQDTSGNTSEVAEPKTVQDAETNAQYAEQRRKQELDEYRTKAESYQQHLDRVAQLTGYQTHDELLQALEEAEKEQERAQYEQAGITPEKFNELLEKHPEMQQLREIQKKQQEAQQLQTEAGELFEAFPELTADSIPAEAWQMREQRGISLFDAYLRTTYKSLGQQKEQEAIQKLQTNAQSSPGSLSEGEPQHNTNVSSLSSKDFNSLVERVKRGENVQL